jgi:hypothetical protein
VLRTGQRSRRVVLGLQCGETRTLIFLGLQVSFRADDGGLGCVVFRRAPARRARGRSGDDGLAGIAHFLHGRTHPTAKQTGNSHQNNNEPQHRVARH